MSTDTLSRVAAPSDADVQTTLIGLRQLLATYKKIERDELARDDAFGLQVAEITRKKITATTAVADALPGLCAQVRALAAQLDEAQSQKASSVREYREWLEEQVPREVALFANQSNEEIASHVRSLRPWVPTACTALLNAAADRLAAQAPVWRSEAARWRYFRRFLSVEYDSISDVEYLFANDDFPDAQLAGEEGRGVDAFVDALIAALPKPPALPSPKDAT